MKLSELDNFRPSPVQMAPVAPQSVVAGSSMVTSPVPCGFTVMSQGMLLGLSVLCALSTDPPVSLKAWSRRVDVAQAELLAELDLEGELGRAVVSRRGGDLQPDGEGNWGRRHRICRRAGKGLLRCPRSSVKDTRTWMVCPCSLAVRVWVEPVAPLMADPPANHW